MVALAPSRAPRAPGPSPGASVYDFDARLHAPGFRWEGRVVAVFGTAALAERDGDETAQGMDRRIVAPRFLTLLDPRRPLGPFGLRLPEGVGRLQPGAPLRLEAGTLYLDALRGGGDVEAHALSGSGRQLSMATPGDLGGASRREIAARLARLPLPRRTLALLGRAGPEGTPVERLATAAAAAGLKALFEVFGREPVEAGPLPAAQRLCGLGPGSTPTGDDLLVGAAAMAWALWGTGLLLERHLQALCLALGELPLGRTTLTAQEMLREAARGYFAEPLLELVRALVRQGSTREELVSATGELLTLGHHSGADLLAGAIAMAERAARSAAPNWDHIEPRLAHEVTPCSGQGGHTR